MKLPKLTPLFATIFFLSGLGPVYSQDDFGFGDLGGGEEASVEEEAAPDGGGGMDPSDLGFGGDDAGAMDIPEMSEMTEEEREEEAARVAEQERVRLEERKQRARGLINESLTSMDNQKWQIAVDQVEQAQGLLEDVGEMEDEIRIARETKSEAYFQMARTLFDNRKQGANLDQARDFLRESREAWEGNDKIDMLLADIKEYQQKVDDGKIPQPIEEEPKYEKISRNVRRLLVRGRKELEIGDYDRAEKTFQQVLRYDRYNKDALRFLTKVAEEQYEARRVERDLSIAKMLKESEEAWLYPLDVDKVGAQETFQPADGDIMVEEEALTQRLRQIPVRQINFRRAHISDVISELVRISREMDPDGIGVNIIFMDPELADSGADAGDDGGAAPAQDDIFGAAFGGGGGTRGGDAPAAPSIKPITLELRNVTLLDALETVTEIANLYYRVDGNVVVIQRKGQGQMITRFYPVDPARWTQVTSTLGNQGGGGGGGGGGDPFGDPFGRGGGGGGAVAEGPDLNALFERYGVSVPDNGGIAYEPLIAQLVVTLTPDEFPQFEQVLGKINVAPSQVQIEARFVEVNQQDLEELGVEWIFTDDVELLVENGPGPIAGRQRVQADANPQGVTSGLRFFDFDSVSQATAPTARSSDGNSFLGDVLSLRGVLTNPELQMIIHALEQKGNSDLLSAPRVTTINGVNAIIEVVEEIIYPTEFDVTENDIQVQDGGGDGAAAAPVFVPPTVIPGGFETRDVGVILNVTPTVGADNYTINLVMLPEIAELVDWVQYGTQVPIGDQTFIVNMPQPIFASRNITTSMIVWDGHTVVMGGLIREQLTTFEDKIPLLGDIPLLGRLFRSEGTRSQKRNLMIFVTARLVDPAGNNVNQANREDLLSN